MHFPSLLFAATACMRMACADFLVITEPPWPSSFEPTTLAPSGMSSWTISVVINAIRSFEDLTDSLGAPYESSHSSVFSDLSTFAAAASNYSIPPGVLESTATETFLSKPDWYDAMPSNVRSWKEAEWTTIQSLASGVIARRLPGSSTGGAPALPTAGPAALGRAQWAVAAGAAYAVFL